MGGLDVAAVRPWAGATAVERRRAEVRDRDAVDRIRPPRALARIADLDEDVDRLAVLPGRRAGAGLLTGRIGEHLEQLVAGDQRPAAMAIDQRVRLAVLVGVDAERR